MKKVAEIVLLCVELILYPIQAGVWCYHCLGIGDKDNKLFALYGTSGIAGILALTLMWKLPLPTSGILGCIGGAVYFTGAVLLWRLIDKKQKALFPCIVVD